MKNVFLLLVLISTLSYGQNIPVTSTTIFEGEPTLAVHPQNSQQLVAAWIGVDLVLGGVIKTSFSSDGGLTWSTPQIMQHIVSGNGSADPSLQYDLNGNVYLCNIDYDSNNFTNGQIIVRKSADNGATWGAPVEAINAITDCPDKYCVDRPWMEIDRSGGPNTGTIYVTSMNPDQPTLVIPPYNPFLAVSTDGGATFNTPRYLDTVNYYSGDVIQQPMPSPAIGADGTFFAAYPAYDTNQYFLPHIYLASSTNQGVTVDHANLYTVLMAGVTNPLAKAAGKLISDPSTANHLFSIYCTETNGDIDLYYMETYDAVSWTAPARLNQDPIGNGKMQDLVWGDFNENGDLAVCWRDRRNASANGYSTETEIYGVIRFKDSINFEQDFAISDQQVPHDAVLEGKANDFMSVRFVGDTLYSIWGDVRSGTLNIYINRYNVITGTNSTTEIWSEKPIIGIYPNPATENITMDNFDICEDVKIMDIKGRWITDMDKANKSIEDFDPGTYYAVGKFNGEMFSVEFVKQ